MMASRGLSITVTFQPVATSHRPLSSLFYTITVWYKSVSNALERERGLLLLGRVLSAKYVCFISIVVVLYSVRASDRAAGCMHASASPHRSFMVLGCTNRDHQVRAGTTASSNHWRRPIHVTNPCSSMGGDC
jgi:hypothetical protein